MRTAKPMQDQGLRTTRTLLAAVAAATLVGGCTWVELTDAGNAVQVAAAAPDDCRLVGHVDSHTRAVILGGIGRNADRVEDELEWLARNEAARLGANTIVPKGPVADGRRGFDALICPD